MKHVDNKKSAFAALLGNRKFIRINCLIIGLYLISSFILKAQSNASYYLNNAAVKGTYNSAFGYQSLYKNTGSYNTATGYQALYLNTTGSYNTANGMYALYSNTTGQSNTAIGINALYNNDSGFENTAIGNNALLNNISGEKNTAIGAFSLQNNITGIQNTAVGNETLYKNLQGVENIAIGNSSMYNNDWGSYNTAVGVAALYSNTMGNNNTSIGNRALFLNTASANTAVGSGALQANISGYYNTAMGNDALSLNVKGYKNSAVGYQALYKSTGNHNTADGYKALYETTTGSGNTAMGFAALNTNTTGSNNTAIGNYAGFANLIGLTNTTTVGNQANATVSNSAVIGNTAVTKIGGYANWSNLSDARFKKDVKQDVHGLDFILQLKPVTYHMDVKKLNAFLSIGERNAEAEKEGASQEDAALKQIEEQAIREKEAILYTGFLAQDVEQAAKAVNYDFSGIQKPAHEKDHYSLSYGDFVVPLVKAVQEQQQMIEAQKLVNEQLKQEVEELKKTVAVLTGSTSSVGVASETGAAAESIKVYPNPSKGAFTVTIERPGRGTLEVYDFSGNKVQSLTLQSNVSEYKIDLSSKQKGVYTVQIVSEGQKTTKRIVLE